MEHFSFSVSCVDDFYDLLSTAVNAGVNDRLIKTHGCGRSESARGG